MRERAGVKWGAVGLVALAALWLIVAWPAGLSGAQAATLGAVLMTLALWNTGVIAPYLASLTFFAVMLISGLASPDQVFAGFSSAAIWLIVSGFVIGAAIGNSGLGAQLAGVLGPRLGASYPQLLAGLMVVAVLLGFVMPSSVGRAVLLVPIGMALADRLGLAKGSSGRTGVAVLLAIACNTPSYAVLPSNIPNVILAGAAENIQGVTLGYMEYLVLHFPVLGLLKSIVIVGLVLWLFPGRIAAGLAPDVAAPRAPKALQIRVGLMLLVTLAFWMTDRVHGINPAWIGLATAVILLMPGIGAVGTEDFRRAVDFPLLVFVAGALALGVVVNASGLGGVIGGWLEHLLPMAPGATARNFFSLSAMSTVIGMIATVPGVPAVLTPMAGDLATLSGFDLKAVLMTQVVGFSTVIFPYQVGPLVVAMQLSGERLGALLKVMLVVALVTVLVLMPLDYLWWRLLGWI